MINTMTSKDFYCLIADPEAVTRWFLRSPYDPAGNKIDPRIFTCGNPVDIQLASGVPSKLRTRYYGNSVEARMPLTVPVGQAGDEVDFNFCAFDMVVTPRVFNKELEALVGKAIQRIPVTVEGKGDKYEILNVCDVVRCVDEKRSEHIMKWTAEDGRPDRTGTYRMIIGLKIDPAAASGHHIFRVYDWEIALIVSGEVKKLLEARKITGLGFQRVDV